jgi:deoxyribonuclease V
MQVRKLHSWKLSYSGAIAIQEQLAGKVRFTPFKGPVRFVGGLDCAFSRDGRKIIAVAVVLELPGFGLIEKRTAVRKVAMPYIPGLLSFREAPVCISAVKKLSTEPDIFLVDGQGIAHPRRLGLASHLGLFFDKPTVGCAKSRLTGSFREPPSEKGCFTLLKDARGAKSKRGCQNLKGKDEVIGAVLRTRSNVKPVFVSVGNKCLLEDAIKITLECTGRYRVPEPTRLAHQLVGRLKLEG